MFNGIALTPCRPMLVRPFVPTDIANLALWYDPSDLSTITIATGVSQINDKSGNARHATQANTTFQPINTNTLNGKRCLTFDGTDDRLTIPAGAFSIPNSSNTVFVVTRSAVGAAGGDRPFGAQDAGTSRYTLTRDYSANTLQGVNNTTTAGASVTSLTTNTNPNLFAMRYTAGTGVRVWHNATNVSGTGASFTATNFQLGASNSGNLWQGDIGEFLIYQRALTDVEVNRVAAYLAAWGTPPIII